MLQYFAFLKEYFQLNGAKASIDNEFFKFHYRYTSIILLVCCILVGSKDIFGQDIKCDPARIGVPQEFLNQYCYYQYVFTVVNKSDHGQPLPGKILGIGDVGEGYERRYHVYYQWVATVLFLQALVFYLPHYFWKKIEGGRIKTLVDGLELAKYSHGDNEVCSKDMKIPSRSSVDNKLEVIKKDIILRFHTSRSWSLGLVMAELTNLVNVMLQVYLTNEFLDGLFMRVGLVAAEQNFALNGLLYPPMNKLFPKVVMCGYITSTTADSRVSLDTQCVLQQNNTNDKIYTALWYWYILLFIVSILGALWRLMTLMLFKTRWFNTKQFNKRDNPCELYEVASICDFSDWLFLSYLHKNTSRAIFTDIVASVASELKDKYGVKRPGIGFKDTFLDIP